MKNLIARRYTTASFLQPSRGAVVRLLLLASLLLSHCPISPAQTPSTQPPPQTKQQQRDLGLGTEAKKPQPSTTTSQTIATHPELVLQTGVTSPVRIVAFSPDNRLLAAMDSLGKGLKLYETGTGRELRQLSFGSNSATNGALTTFTFSDNGKTLTATDGALVKVWDVMNGEKLRETTLPQTKGFGASLALSSDGKMLALTNEPTGEGQNPSVKLFDALTGRQLFDIAQDERPLCLAFNADACLLALGVEIQKNLDTRTEIQLWDTKTGKQLRAITVTQAKIKRNDAMTGAFKNAAPVRAIIFSPDGRRVGMTVRDTTRTSVMGTQGTHENSFKLYDVATGREERTLKFGDSQQINSLNATLDNFNLQRAAFSDDGKMLATVGEDNQVKIFETENATQQKLLTGHTGQILCVTFSHDAKTIATTSTDKTIKLWDAATGRERRTLGGRAQPASSVVFGADGQTLVTGAEASVNIWRLKTGESRRAIAFNDQAATPNQSLSFDDLNPVILSPDAHYAVARTDDHTAKLYEVASGRAINTFALEPNKKLGGSAFTADGKILAFAADISRESAQQSINVPSAVPPSTSMPTPQILARTSRPSASSMPKINVADMQKKQKEIEAAMKRGETGRAMEMMQEMMGTIGASNPAIGQILGNAMPAANAARPTNDIRVVATADGSEQRTLTRPSGGLFDFNLRATNIAFAPDNQTLAAATSRTTIKLFDAKSGVEKGKLENGRGFFITQLAWSNDGRMLAAAYFEMDINVAQSDTISPDALKYVVRVWDAATGQQLRALNGHQSMVTAIAFSPDNRTLATGGYDNTAKLWDVATGRKLSTLAAHDLGVSTLAFSPDNHLLVSGSEDGGTRLWNAQSGELLATLVNFNQGIDWLVITPDGLFDGSPTGWSQVLWRYDRNTFNVAPVEWFFNEFYYPGLLSDIIAGKHPHAAQDISQKDRRQPQLSITANATGDAVTTRTINVKLNVNGTGAGARDVRLFRNGTLVHVWHGDVLKESESATLETPVTIVAGVNQLSAYAFNRDNVKSMDARLLLRGADALRRSGTLHIIAIGINAYANTQYNLKYAVADAQAFADEVQRQQTKLNRYARVETISLNDNEATKANILGVLKRLAGDVSATVPQKFSALAAAQPEDAMMLFYAGHGTAQGQRFYLIPHDLGYTGARNDLHADDLQQVLAHSVSDIELQQAIENIDAENLLITLDACNSGQALESEEKRRGPMNSKGLAQLAYEKGIYILTAAQSYQAALEAAQLGHGFLTFALIEEALKAHKATADDAATGSLNARSWFDYATERVPQMQLEKMRQARGMGLDVAFVEGDERKLKIEDRDVQRPRVFYRREIEAQPFIVATMNAP
jgi:WD40 repeat protein